MTQRNLADVVAEVRALAFAWECSGAPARIAAGALLSACIDGKDGVLFTPLVKNIWDAGLTDQQGTESAVDDIANKATALSVEELCQISDVVWTEMAKRVKAG